MIEADTSSSNGHVDRVQECDSLNAVKGTSHKPPPTNRRGKEWKMKNGYMEKIETIEQG